MRNWDILGSLFNEWYPQFQIALTLQSLESTLHFKEALARVPRSYCALSLRILFFRLSLEVQAPQLKS